MMNPKLASALAALLLILASAACSFSPNYGAGVLACGAGSAEAACPKDYQCVQGYCCKPGESLAVCPGALVTKGGNDAGPIDAGAPDQTLPPEPDAAADTATAGPIVRRVVTGSYLINYWDSCTQGQPAGAQASPSIDRWCAFVRGPELWVLNVTQAARQDIPCNGADPRCRLLTRTHYDSTAQGDAYAEPAFFGDLLLFYADATHVPGPDVQFEGGVYAWYPGWPEARRLTSAKGRQCFSNAFIAAPAAWCSDRADDGARVRRAGLIPEGGLLPVFPLPSADGIIAQFNATGDRFLFALETEPVPPAVDSPRQLFMVPTSSAADRSKWVALAPNAKETFTIASDGDFAYFVREEGTPAGTLALVDTGTGLQLKDTAVKVETVGRPFDFKGRHVGIVTREATTGVLSTAKLYFDRAMLSSPIALGPTGPIYVSPDRHYSLTTTAVDPQRRHNLRVVDNTGPAGNECFLQRDPVAENTTGPVFSEDGRLVFWSEPGADATQRTAWVASAKGCANKRQYSAGVGAYTATAGGGLLYEEYDQGGGQFTSLRYVRLDPETGAAIEAPLLLRQQVRSFRLVPPQDKLVVFDSVEPGREGLYLAEFP